MGTEKILDLGCGKNKVSGATGLDRVALPGVDIVHDMNVYPYPLEDNSFDRIVLKHIVEHIPNLVSLMNEVHRIGKPGSIVEIETPHFTSTNSYNDPTHVHHFSLLAFDFFCGDTKHDYLLKNRFRRSNLKVNFWPIHDTWSWFSYRLLGMKWIAEKHPVFFERFLTFFTPVRDFKVQLEVIKT